MATPPKIYFETGSAAIGAEGTAALDRFALWALGTGDRLRRIRVTGHSDRTGSRNVRERIALARARMTADALFARGIPSGIVEVVGAADRQPEAGTADHVREPLNRRVELDVGLAETPNDEGLVCG